MISAIVTFLEINTSRCKSCILMLSDITISLILSHMLFGALLTIAEVLHRLFGWFASPQHEQKKRKNKNKNKTKKNKKNKKHKKHKKKHTVVPHLPTFLPSHSCKNKCEMATKLFARIWTNFQIAPHAKCVRNLHRRGSILKGTLGYVSVGDSRNDKCQLWYGRAAKGNSPSSPRVMLMSGLCRQMWCVSDMFRVCKLKGWEVVTFDKRDVGLSGKSVSRVTTQTLAHDAWDLAKSLGWNDPRGFHIVGESFGGMIAQELALMLPPNVVQSLSLVVTYSGGSLLWNLPPFFFKPFTMVSKLVRLCRNHRGDEPEFQAQFIHEMQGCNDQQSEFHLGKIRERLDMFGGELNPDSPVVKRGLRTHLEHIGAAATHYLSPRRLEDLRKKSFKKYVYGSGPRDMIVQHRNSPALATAILATLTVYEDAGHNLSTSAPHFIDQLVSGIEEAAKPAVDAA